MKKTVFSIVALFFALSVFAQVNDSKSKAILKKASDQMKSYNTMKINFTYHWENNVEKIDETKTGELWVKGEKYFIKFNNQEVICDGKNLYLHLKDVNEVQINTISEDADITNPTAILKNYNQKFKSKYIREEHKNGKVIQIVDLVPKKGRSYFKVRLEIDKKTSNIVKTIVFDKKGSTFTYNIDKLQTNVALDDSRLNFNKSNYPDAEIIDMR